MAYNPTTGKWEEEEASVSGKLTGLLSSDSDYMKQARRRGTQTAARRGLQNSSIAAGAAHGAAIERALPIAQQDAGQIHQRNVMKDQYGYEGGLLGRRLEHESSQLGRQLEHDTASQRRLYGHQAAMQTQALTAEEQRQASQLAHEASQLGRQLTFEEQQLVARHQQEQLMQGREFGQRTVEQQRQIQFQTDAQIRDIQALAERQGRDITAQEQAQIRDLEAQQLRQTADLQHQLTMQAGEFGQRTAEQQRAIDAATADLIRQLETQTTISFANIASHDREKAAALAAAFENSYAEMYRTIGQNADLPAAVRDKYLAHAGAIRDSNFNLLQQMYGIDLEWETEDKAA